MGSLLDELGATPTTTDEWADCIAIFEDVDERGSRLLDRDEFAIAAQRITLRLRALQKEREKQYIVSAGLSEKHLQELRQAFQRFDEDMSEVLEKDELCKVIETLKGQYWQSSSNIDHILTACGVDVSKEIKVRFLHFMRIMRMLDESEVRRQQGLTAGFRDRDRVDLIYSVFQGLRPDSDENMRSEANGTKEDSVRNDTIENALKVACRNFTGTQSADLIMALSAEPSLVTFPSFLRVIKEADRLLEEHFENFLEEMRKWEEIVEQEGFEGLLNGDRKMSRKTLKKSAKDVPNEAFDLLKDLAAKNKVAIAALVDS